MTQKEMYEDIWKRFSGTKTSSIFKPVQAFSIGIDISLPKSTNSKINKIIQKLKYKFPNNEFIEGGRYHITIVGLKGVGKIYDRDILAIYERKIRNICNMSHPFELEIKRLNSFSSLIFIEVYSKKDELNELNKKISNELGTSDKFEFVPHISVIFFKGKPDKLLKEIRDKYREVSFGKILVKEIELIEWDLHPKTGLSSPRIIKKFKLRANKRQAPNATFIQN